MPGHQNSGAPTYLFRVFLMVYLHLRWQCSDKTRKCQVHINTLRKNEKLKFLKPILEIKTGTRTLVPFQADKQIFVLISIKNGLQEYQFLFFPKCIYFKYISLECEEKKKVA